MKDFDIKTLYAILNSTIQKIQEGKGEIDEISRQVSDECEKLKNDLQEISQKVNQIIKKVDSFQYKEKLARYELFITSRDFHVHDEEDMKEPIKRLWSWGPLPGTAAAGRKLRQERDKLTA